MTEFSPWPSFTNEERDAVSQVLMSNKVNYWTGNETRLFESEFSAYVGAAYAVAVCNGTVALELALKALDLGPGDEVIVTPRTFIASVSCVVNCGAIPVFADVDPNSGNITARSIEAVITARTKAVICVHLAGVPCDMDPITKLATEFNLSVVEDCAQSHGAVYKGRVTGSIGDIGCWSFCQDKIMSTGGEGGMIVTKDKDLWSKMWSLKDHGKSWEAVHERDHQPGFRWLHEEFGTNYRLTEMQSAIGRIQLTKLNDWVRRRRSNSARIDHAVSDFRCVRTVPKQVGIENACYKHYVYVVPEFLKAGWTRDRLIHEISARGVPCYQGSCSEVYLEKAFVKTSFRPKPRLRVAAELGESSLMFLVHPTLTQTEMVKTCAVIQDVLTLASL